MAADPEVLGLLEEMLDSGKTPEEVCRERPELLSEVQQRWQALCRIDAQLGELFPELGSTSDGKGTKAGPASASLPRIAGYQVEAVLGSGGMGVVYKARQCNLDRPVAVKMLLAGPFAGAQELGRFRQETAALGSLLHPNIVQVYDAGDVEGRPYFAMELIEGGNLADKLSGTPQPARQAAELVVTLAQAVQVAHRAGIVHRDLKPGNILLAADGTPKITDFGLARRVESNSGLTQTGVPVGTPSYMAPEQARGRSRVVGPAVDVYALGAILYELLTGRPPFRGESQAETVLQVINQDPVPPSRLNASVPRDVETICLKCLHKEPERRYGSAAALSEDLTRYLQGEAIVARPVGTLERAGKWVRRNKWVTSLSAIALCALIAGTVVSLVFAFEARRQEILAMKRADELEEKTRIANRNAKAAVAAREEAERVTVVSLLTPIFGNARVINEPLGFAEITAFRQMQDVPKEIRLQLLETGLREPETARRLGLRADWVIQALVGWDRALRAQVRRIILQRVQEPEVPQETMFACARLGLALNLDDSAWAVRSAGALSAELRDPQSEPENSTALAESLAAVCEQLPQAQAADHAARVIEVYLARLKDRSKPGLGLTTTYSPAMVTLSPYLDAAAAKHIADSLGTLFRQPTPGTGAWPHFCRAQAAACRRLPPADAAACLGETVDFIIHVRDTTEESDKPRYTFYAQSLGDLCGQLDAPTTTRDAEGLIAMLGDRYTVRGLEVECITDFVIAEELARVAEYLGPDGGLQAFEALMPVLTKAEKLAVNMELLKKAVVALARRLDAAGAAHVAEACAEAIRDPKTPVLARALLGDAFAVVSGRLDPAKAATLESDIVDSLIANLADTDPKHLPARERLGEALGSICGRRGSTSAALAAPALCVAISDPKTLSQAVRPLAATLAEVCSQLAPAQASAQAKKAVDALDLLWAVKTTAAERAPLAKAIAPLWIYLGPGEAASHAKRMATVIEAEFHNATANSSDLASLADALTVVCDQLDSADGSVFVNNAVDAVIARLPKPGNRHNTREFFGGAIGILWLRLSREDVARVGDTTLLAGLGVSDPERYQFDSQVNMFKRIAAQMDDRDLERMLEHPLITSAVRRTILDLLGKSRNRHFRNTWDYLDWCESTRRRGE